MSEIIFPPMPAKWASDQPAIAAYSAYFGLGGTAAALVGWQQLEAADRETWRAVVDAAAVVGRAKSAGAQANPAGNGAPGSESRQPASVIIVTEIRGNGFAERRYAARGWDAEETVDITDGERVIATYPPGTWHSVRADGATVRETAVEDALRMAKAALEAIAADAAAVGVVADEPGEVARQALAEILAETGL